MIATAPVLIAAAGLAALAARYLFGPAPSDYHRRLLEQGGVAPGATHERVFRMMYQVLGGAFLALAGLAALLALGPMRAGEGWGIAGVALIAGAAGGVGTWAPLRVERETGMDALAPGRGDDRSALPCPRAGGPASGLKRDHTPAACDHALRQIPAIQPFGPTVIARPP